MAFKSLLVPVQDSPASARALARAVEFAARTGGDLSGVMARPPVALLDPWMMSGDAVQQLADDQAAGAREAEREFREATRTLKGRSHWLFRQDFPNVAVRDAAAAADLIVTGVESGPDASFVDVSGLLLEAGVPVVVLPDAAPELTAAHVMIAWRNTTEARRAVTAAMPLLQAADTVTIVQVGTPGEAEAAAAGLQAVKARLARNGVTAETEFAPPTSAGEAWSLLNSARARGADLIVLGAYGHSRAREWVLGGVTRDLLEASTLPLFLVH